MQSEDQKQLKQQYLREHVIEKGYDAQEFMNFIGSQKQDGQNIDLWELNQLKQVVQQFITNNKPVCQTQQPDYNEDNYQDEDEEYTAQEEKELENNNQILIQPGQQTDDDYLDRFEKKFMAKIQNQIQNEYPQQQQNQEMEIVKQDDIETIQPSDDQNPQSQEKKKNPRQFTDEQLQFICNNNFSQKRKEQQTQGEIQQQEEEDVANMDNPSKFGFELQENKDKKEFNQVKIKDYAISVDPYEREMKCDQHVISIPIYSRVKVVISDPRKVQTGLLGLSVHYSFRIVTKPYNWEVRRKMKDFITLRNVLNKIFPAKIIPPLDTSNSENSNWQLNKRMKYLVSFINDLKQSPEIWSSQYVIDFLSMQDDKKFDKIMAQTEREQPIQKIKDMTNLSGKHKSILNNDTYNYKEQTIKYFNNAEQKYKQLHILSKQLKKDFEKIGCTMSSVGITYHELFGCFNDFDSKISIGKDSNSKLKESYVSMNNLLMSWSKSMQQNCIQVSDKLIHLFKYCNNEIQSVKEIQKKVADSEKLFCKHRQSLLEKKEKLFRQDISRWEYDPKYKEEVTHVKNNKQEAFKYMLAKETTYEQFLKEQYGFWLNTQNNEIQRQFRKNSEDYRDFLRNFSRLETNIINELLGSWGQISNDYGLDNPFPQPKVIAPSRFSIDNKIIHDVTKQSQ